MSETGGYGTTLADAGDVNADGFRDIIVSASHVDKRRGAAWLISGRDGSTLQLLRGAHRGAEFGWSIAGIGDVNRDGHDDFAIGARYDNRGGRMAGAVVAYSGKDGRTLYVLGGEAPYDLFGSVLAPIGDVDGDGIADFAVAAWRNEGALIAQDGRVYVYSGSTGRLLHRFVAETKKQIFGTAIAGAGDLDGDDLADILIGAPQITANDAGSVYVYSGATGHLLDKLEGDSSGGAFGSAIVGGEDLNGDGIPDIVVSADYSDVAGPGVGRVHVFSGRSRKRLFFLDGERPNEFFGRSLALVPDLDGDTVVDLAVGALSNAGAQEGGRVYFFSGKSGRCLRALTSLKDGSSYFRGIVAIEGLNRDGGPHLLTASGKPDRFPVRLHSLGGPAEEGFRFDEPEDLLFPDPNDAAAIDDQTSTASLVESFQNDRGPLAALGFRELQRRQSRGALTAATISDMTRTILDYQRDASKPWWSAWGDFIESAYGADAIPRSRYETYLEQSVILHVRARQIVRLGDDLPIQVESPTMRLGDVGDRNVEPVFLAMKAEPGPVRGSAVSLGFRPSFDNQIDAQFLLTPLEDEPLLPVGQHHIRFELRLIMRGIGWKHIHEWKTWATVVVTVLPAGEDSVRTIVRDELRDQIRDSIVVTAEKLADGKQIFVQLDSSKYAPIDFPFRVILRTGEREWDSGFRGHTGPNGRTSGGSYSDAVGADCEFVDVILRPDLDQARLTIDMVEIWGEEVVFERVKIVGPEPQQRD